MKIDDRVKFIRRPSWWPEGLELETHILATFHGSPITQCAVLFPEATDVGFWLEAAIIETFQRGYPKYNVSPTINQYLGRRTSWHPITSFMLVETPIVAARHKQHDGCFCKTCGTFAEMAQPNMSDGSFACYTCRSSPIRAYY